MEELAGNRPSTEITFLYFGNDWFAENRTSSHHIARWLANDHRVYYVECPGLRAPKTSGRDLKKIWSKVVRFAKGPRTVGENVKVLTLLQVPLHRFRLVRWLNQSLILATPPLAHVAGADSSPGLLVPGPPPLVGGGPAGRTALGLLLY